MNKPQQEKNVLLKLSPSAYKSLIILKAKDEIKTGETSSFSKVIIKLLEAQD